MRKPLGDTPEKLAAGRKAPGLSVRQRGGWRDALEAYGEALGVAESGEAGLAREMLGEFRAEHRKILVLSEDGAVPEAMVTYSVGLAERLGFDLVLLSVLAPERRGQRAEELAREGARPMLEEAARRGVPCAQLVRRGKPGEVLSSVTLELRRVEFVITRRPEAERKHAALPVPEFSLKC
jgi:hypothetical protein